MLEVGNGRMSQDEYRTHFVLWAMIAAPLIAGNDLRDMTPEIHELLTNKEIIAVGQDALGAGGKELYKEADIRVWSKPLASGDVAIAAFNTGSAAQTVTLSKQRLGLDSQFAAQNLILHKAVSEDQGVMAVWIAPHGVSMFRFHKKP